MSELKQVKVISVTGNGSFKSQYGDQNGLLYSFVYTLQNENGKDGEFHVNHKSPDPKFKAGEVVEFEPKGETPKGDKKAKLSKPNNGGGGSGGRYSGSKGRNHSEQGKYPSFALSYAKDIFIAHGAMGNTNLPTPSDVTQYITGMADDLLKWLNENSEE